MNRSSSRGKEWEWENGVVFLHISVASTRHKQRNRKLGTLDYRHCERAWQWRQGVISKQSPWEKLPFRICPRVSHTTSLGLGSLFSKTERLENKLTNWGAGLYNLSGSISKCVCQVILMHQERLYGQADSHLVTPRWSCWCPGCILIGQWLCSEGC